MAEYFGRKLAFSFKRNTAVFFNLIEHDDEAIENIDIGGPGMLRAASKNHQDVTVITDPADYSSVLNEIKEHGGVSLKVK